MFVKIGDNEKILFIIKGKVEDNNDDEVSEDLSRLEEEVEEEKVEKK
jgi:hypothetical protein